MVLMIVCVCRRLNEKKIAEAIEAGACSPPAVMAHHGTRFNCGQCRMEMSDLISRRPSDPPSSGMIAAE